MVDYPIQHGNWFSSLRAWHSERRHKAERPRSGGAERTAAPERRQESTAGEVELSRLAMAAPLEE